MAKHTSTGYAPIDADNGKLWAQNCDVATRHQLFIYETAEAAEAHKVCQTDLVKEITMTWDDGK